MIIDIHSHLAYAPIYPQGYLTGMFMNAKNTRNADVNRFVKLFLRDKDGSAFIKQMDAAGIDKAVLLIIDGGIRFGEPELGIDDIFRLHDQIQRQRPDRFIVFAGVDPRRGQAGFDLFRKSIERFGFHGLKLYPPMGYSIDHPELLPYYEYCHRNGLPVLLHTGPSQSNMDNDLADPVLIKPIAEHYTQVKFILAHAGFNLSDKLIGIIENSDNIYIDIAGFRGRYRNFCKSLVEDFKPLFSGKLNKKTLFGTDWPLYDLMSPLSCNVELLQLVADSIGEKEGNAIDNLLYINANELLYRR